MLREIMKGMKMGINIARITKHEAEKEVRAMIKTGMLTRKEGRRLLKTVFREATAERKRVQCFVKQEVTRQMKLAKPIVKKVAKATRGGIKRRAKAVRRIVGAAKVDVRKTKKRVVKRKKRVVKRKRRVVKKRKRR